MLVELVELAVLAGLAARVERAWVQPPTQQRVPCQAALLHRRRCLRHSLQAAAKSLKMRS